MRFTVPVLVTITRYLSWGNSLMCISGVDLLALLYRKDVYYISTLMVLPSRYYIALLRYTRRS